MFGITGSIIKAIRKSPKALIDGIFDVINTPNKNLLNMWNKLSDEDKKLFKDSVISGVRITARIIVAADKGIKRKF